MTEPTSTMERLQDLLADQATQGLDDRERDELSSLLEQFPDVDAMELEWTAAAIDLPYAEPCEPLPAGLRTRVEVRTIAWLAESRGLTIVAPELAPSTAPEIDVRSVTPAASTAGPRWSFAPWLVAAACIMLALLAWWPGSTTDDPASLYSRLADASGSTMIGWTDAGAVGASGDIVWNNASQSGAMHFTGLAANDPSKLQYQLWIFDATREEFNAVDGGVFDVTSPGEVFVPVHAKLAVREPVLFAVTTEPPGGVVKHVTKGDYRIILTAQPDGE